MGASVSQDLRDRSRLAAQLRVAGASCSTIAERLGYRSVESVRNLLARPPVRQYMGQPRQRFEEELLGAYRATLDATVARSQEPPAPSADHVPDSTPGQTPGDRGWSGKNGPADGR